MTNKFITIILVLLTNLTYSQSLVNNEINKTDTNGLKQGIWVKKITANIIDTMNYVDDKLHGHYRSYWQKSNELRHAGEYKNGTIVGIWTYYNNGKIVSEEIERGTNLDSLTNEQGQRILPPYSYVKFYDKDLYFLKSEGKILYFDSWEMDNSIEQGKWIYYNSIGVIIKTRLYKNGKIIKENAP